MACALVHVQLCALILLGHARWAPGLESFCHTCLIIVIVLYNIRCNAAMPLNRLTDINSICSKKKKNLDLFSQATKQLGIYIYLILVKGSLDEKLPSYELFKNAKNLVK